MVTNIRICHDRNNTCLIKNCTQVNTPRRSSEAVVSVSGETVRETVRELSAVGESGVHENELSLRRLEEGDLATNRDVPSKV